MALNILITDHEFPNLKHFNFSFSLNVVFFFRRTSNVAIILYDSFIHVKIESIDAIQSKFIIVEGMEDPYLNLDPSEFFNLLESNAPSVVEDIRSLIHENLNTTKEPWLVQGLYDYSLSKSSLRAMEILLGLRELHSKHLFDRISESLRSSTTKLSALIFLGFLVRKQPQWLHKISSHYVMRDLIKILKTDNDVVVLVNALLVLTALIPIIPNLEAFILNDIFEGSYYFQTILLDNWTWLNNDWFLCVAFSRLAAWNYTNQPKQPEVYVLHLQIALYALFHRLYGMYPCNFLSYLRQHYSVRENLPIFSHTVKPMVETVRMHPLLVTASKDIEIGTARYFFIFII